MDFTGNSSSKCLWTPNPHKRTNFHDFKDKINAKFDLKLENYHDLHRWSVEEYPCFWEEFWHFAGIKSSSDFEESVDKTINIADLPEWFRGSQLNFAENILSHNDDNVAVYSIAEAIPEQFVGYSRPHYDAEFDLLTSSARNGKRSAQGSHSPVLSKCKKTTDSNTHVYCDNLTEGVSLRQCTFAELRKDVSILAAAMRKSGISKGDVVAGYLPNCLEAIQAMLAATSIGAVWSSTSPDFGVTGVLERFNQIQPKMIVSVNAVVYNGKIHNHMNKLEQVINGLSSLHTVIVCPYVTRTGMELDISSIKHSILLADFLKNGCDKNGVVPELQFEQVAFNHPLYIMFSSGTTGVPKCIVHSVGGTLLKHLEEHLLQGNMKRSDIILYYTTTGWMMWNWFVSALAIGAAVVCYDGSPFLPTPNVLWNVIDKLGVTVFGTSAKWLDVIEEKGLKPRETHNLSSLHTILSTGSPLKPKSYDYVYEQIKTDLCLGSITGGTDIIGCFAGHSADLPVYRGEIQGKILGIALDCWGDDGKPVSDISGELVCTKPFPSMPTHFLNDKNNSRYKAAYFEGFAGVWTHGDFCYVSSKTGGIWMMGRSDGTLNPMGVRFGSAEIYNIVESFKEVADALCVGQRSSDLTEERVVLFLQMADGSNFNEDLMQRVRTEIRTLLSARHVPSVILETTAIPYTVSGKKVEIAVKKLLQPVPGQEIKALGAYRNPESLDLYKDIPELRDF